MKFEIIEAVNNNEVGIKTAFTHICQKKKIKIPFSVDSNGEFQVQLDLLGFFFTTSYTPSLYFKTHISHILLVNVKFDSRLLIF